ncbi:MAG: tRNA (cmo5U34)-methyltransferase [Pseudomonadota bacterium]|nr:tRNA (cmo5U34)-methyltransferase [Pseudomonadota bacterium]
MTQSSDQIYSQPLEAITGFVFDQNVVRVFRDMISRSVPGYATLVSMLPVLVQEYVRDNSRCYDLGCSLGAATLVLRHSITQTNTGIVAVDNSPAMIAQCKQYIDQDKSRVPVELHCADICQLDISNASMVVMNFTLQFISPGKRLELLQKIYAGLNPGGVLVLSEKLLFAEPQQTRLTQLHHTFKKLNGYSELEISQKRSALENVLIADTLEQHQLRLQQAGFRNILPWFQCFNFSSLLAVK